MSAMSARSEARRRRDARRQAEAWAAGPPAGMVDVWMDLGSGLLHDGLPGAPHRSRPVYDEGGRGRVSTRSGLLAVVSPADLAAWGPERDVAVAAPDGGLVEDGPDGLVVAGVRVYAPYGAGS